MMAKPMKTLELHYSMILFLTKIHNYISSIQGVVGSSVSGKSDLLHRYLTGEYTKVDSFTGRHKKEVRLDGQSRLLLIRNETGPPDVQVSNKPSN